MCILDFCFKSFSTLLFSFRFKTWRTSQKQTRTQENGKKEKFNESAINGERHEKPRKLKRERIWKRLFENLSAL